MATTFVDYTGDGNATKQFTFPSIQESDIKVKVDEVVKSSGTHYNITGYTTTGGGNVVFTSGNVPTSPSVIHIYRDTNVDSAKATYQAGASVKAGDLNANHEQVLFALQEEQNQLERIGDIKDGSIDSAKIKDDTIVNADVNSAAAIAGTKISPNFGSQNIITTGTAATGAHTVTGNITVSGTVDGRDVATDGSKLDGIESGATADQTATEIRSLVESASDSNVFTDADHSKLNAIEAGATADQTAAEIRTLVESATDSNVFTDADHTKLNNIETGATADQTGAEIKSAYEAESNTNAFTDAEKTKLSGIATGADVTSSNSINALTDVNTSGVADGKILKYDASSSAFIIADDGGSGSGGSSTFTGLSDTPSNFGSAAGKTLKVNSAGNAIEFATVGTDVVNDTTPQLGGNLDVQTNEITTSTTNGNVKLTPNGTGAIEVKGAGGNDGTLQLNCSQNSHGVKIKSPPHSASASYTLTLPNNDGDSNGQVLATDGNGVLSWQNSAFTNANQVIGVYDQSGTPVQRLLGDTEGVTVQGTSGGVSKLMFRDRTTAYKLKFKPVDTLSGNVEFTLPSSDGTNGQFLKTNGSGVLSFASQNIQTLQFPSGATGVSCSTEGEIQINSSNYKVVFDTDTTNTHEISFAGPSSLSKTSAYTLPEDGSNGQFLKTNGSGVLSFADVTSTYNIQINTLSSSSGSGGGSATFNNIATRFTLSNPGTNAQAHLVSVNGVVQKPNSGTSPSEGFAIDGNDIIFASAPATGSDFFILTLGNAISLSVPADNSVTSNKIVDGTIVNADIADDTISEAKLDIHAAPSGTSKVLGYTANGMEWVESAAGATGGGTDKIFWENGQTVTTNYTITNGYNAMSAGPVTINNGIAVTIGTGENWTIV